MTVCRQLVYNPNVNEGAGKYLRRREGRYDLPEIRVGKDENFDSALRRFKRECQRSGVLRDVRKHEHYESPSVRRKKKSEAARQRKHRFR